MLSFFDPFFLQIFPHECVFLGRLVDTGDGSVVGPMVRLGGGGKARFNVATPTNATVTCTAYVLPYNFQTKSI